MGIRSITIEQWVCDKCSHTWAKLERIPGICPRCKSKKWNDLSDVSERVAPVESAKTTNASHPTEQTSVSDATSKGISDADAEPEHDLTYESNNNAFDYAE